MRYKKLWEEPENASPMFIIETPEETSVSWEEKLSDPIVMLKSQLDQVHSHMEIGDDKLPTVRVEFGTAQVAAAFGCKMYIPLNNLPAAGSHIFEGVFDIQKISKPDLNSGWYPNMTALVFNKNQLYAVKSLFVRICNQCKIRTYK